MGLDNSTHSEAWLRTCFSFCYTAFKMFHSVHTHIFVNQIRGCEVVYLQQVLKH